MNERRTILSALAVKEIYSLLSSHYWKLSVSPITITITITYSFNECPMDKCYVIFNSKNLFKKWDKILKRV